MNKYMWETFIPDLMRQYQDDVIKGMLPSSMLWDSAAPFEEFNERTEEVLIETPKPRSRKLMLD